jgi:hypothetical protein
MIPKSDAKIVCIIVIIFVVLLSTSVFFEGYINDTDYVQSEYDKNKYLVRNLPDRKQAANLLGQLRARLIQLIKALLQRHPNDPRVQRLRANFNPDQISETPESAGNVTSYSVNKGEKIVFCIRQRNERNELVDINTLMFVAIHELSHLMTQSIGHTKEFWTNMKFLLSEAMSDGIRLYTYQPFAEQPKPYCGTMITDTPLKP